MLTQNRPWSAITAHLYQKYNIVGEIDLLQVDHSPLILYNQLKALYKDRYENNERILIYHYDTDFYLGETGTTLYNLLLCLTDLDIPFEFCILLTNHYNIKTEISNSPFVDAKNLTTFESNYSLLQSTSTPVCTNIDVDLIKYPFMCLQGIKRTHRVLFSCGLHDRGLLDQGLVSWHFNQFNNSENVSAIPSDPIPDHLHFISITPFTRTNERWKFNQKNIDLFTQHNQRFNSNFKHFEINGEPNVNNFQLDSIKKSFLYVSSETVFNYPYPFLTEKTFKAFLYKRPFVILGAKNSIKQLQLLGFKTFNNMWDESYDQIDDPNTRLLRVLDIVSDICALDVDTLRSMCYTLKETLDYNLSHYINNYSNLDLFKKIKTL